MAGAALGIMAIGVLLLFVASYALLREYAARARVARAVRGLAQAGKPADVERLVSGNLIGEVNRWSRVLKIAISLILAYFFIAIPALIAILRSTVIPTPVRLAMGIMTTLASFSPVVVVVGLLLIIIINVPWDRVRHGMAIYYTLLITAGALVGYAAYAIPSPWHVELTGNARILTWFSVGALVLAMVGGTFTHMFTRQLRQPNTARTATVGKALMGIFTTYTLAPALLLVILPSLVKPVLIEATPIIGVLITMIAVGVFIIFRVKPGNASPRLLRTLNTIAIALLMAGVALTMYTVLLA